MLYSILFLAGATGNLYFRHNIHMDFCPLIISCFDCAGSGKPTSNAAYVPSSTYSLYVHTDFPKWGHYHCICSIFQYEYCSWFLCSSPVLTGPEYQQRCELPMVKNRLTPRSLVLQKAAVAWSLGKCPLSHETQTFHTSFKITRNWALSWAKRIQSPSSFTVSVMSSFGLRSLFWKNKTRLMRSPCCLRIRLCLYICMRIQLIFYAHEVTLLFVCPHNFC
jgi:hypothetical protein